MGRSCRSQMRIPFQQTHGSSSSLQGMEKPVRSFRSFIKTVPPNPRYSPDEKPLPPSPAEKGSPSSPRGEPPASPTSSTVRSTSNAVPWKAPADWSHGLHPEQPIAAPPIPSSREYSPLLPDPSPEPNDKHVEITVAQADTLASQKSRLMPIYERADIALGPPRSPPRSPLPLPPKSPVRPDPPDALQPHRSGNSPPPKTTNNRFDDYPRNAETSVPSSRSKKSSPSDNDKLYLGTETNRGLPPFPVNGSHEQQADIALDSPFRRHPMKPRVEDVWGRNRARERYAFEESDDTDTDEDSRDFRSAHVNNQAPPDQRHGQTAQPDGVYKARAQTLRKPNTGPSMLPPESEAQLVPRPLSWKKESNSNTPRSPSETSQTRIELETSTIHSSGASSTKNTKGKRLSDKVYQFVPRRLSVGPPVRNSNNDKTGRGGSFKWKPSLGSREETGSAEELRFSNFFVSPRGRRRGAHGTASDKNQVETITRPVGSESESPAPIFRLPLGLAVVRTSGSRKNSGSKTPTDAQSAKGRQPRSDFSSEHSATPPMSPTISENRTSDPRSSKSAGQHSGAGMGETATGQRTLALRNSHTSDPPSRHSSNNSDRKRRPNPKSQPHTPPSVPLTSFPSSPPSSSAGPTAPATAPTSKNAPSSHLHDLFSPYLQTTRREGATSSDTAWKRPNFLEKVREARRRHEDEARHDKLKKSIRVLGPTDPHVVEGYVKREGRQSVAGNGGAAPVEPPRVPGYMTGGFI